MRKGTRLRLSPNEEARILREELERRRKLRIQQVREQHRHIAQRIRIAVEQRRKHELEQLGKALREDWEHQQREKINTLQKLYQESLELLGQAHRSAKENEPDLAAIAQKEEENHTKAEQRYQDALKELKSQRLKDIERQNRCINARKKALQTEKERAAKVASLPPPPPNPILNIDLKKPRTLKKSDVSAFAFMRYHMFERTVDRELDNKQPSAHEGAEVEERRLQELERDENRRREEQFEKALLRGKQALRREHLEKDRERFLVELEHMQQTDLLRRRQQVSKMPPQIFQPLYRRQEVREDFQREMEFAFEDMYTGERRVKDDLVLQLVPEPLPVLSIGSQDQELDITLDEVTSSGAENTLHDTEQEPGRTELQPTVQAVEPTKHAPRRALKRLLDRIRSQRNQWTEHDGHVTAAGSPTVFIDEIPEWGTTIDTGSLTSEEKSKEPPTEIPKPDHSPPASETIEQSTAADFCLPDVLANRNQEFTEEQKKKEDELEREKQQQVVLLQELEEQKTKLEQMLLEAQQEREHLKAAMTHEVPINQSEVPVCDQEVTPGKATELAPPSGEDDHIRQIREYQQRLLEQNRIHQRSVEVARQRLEEYQRALQIRYNMAAMKMLPPHLIHPPLHSTQSLCLPPTLPLPTTPAVLAPTHVQAQTSVQIPTRECEMSASPPHPPGPSLKVCSRLPPNEVDSILGTSKNQRPDVSAWLADGILESVTEHLPDRVRPSSVTREPLPYQPFTTYHSISIPPQSTSDPIQAITPHITNGEPLVPGHEAALSETMPHVSLLTGSLTSKEDMEAQKRELQETQTRMHEQREAMVLQQRQLEEKRQRQELEVEQMRKQKEMLQALIHTDAQPQPVPESATEENICQIRRKLLASLLRAVEETNGGTLSHLEDTREIDYSTPQPTSMSDPISQSAMSAGPSPASALPTGFLPPHRAVKPPVTRVKIGAMEMMTEQHELSVIPEVETPLSISQVTGPEDSVRAPSQTVESRDQDPVEGSKLTVGSDWALQTPSWSSTRQRFSEIPTSSGTSSGRSSLLIWRERLLTGAGTSPESSEADSRIVSPLSSDSGRGADYSGAAATSYRSPTESSHRAPDSDCLSSTTISTGSYITTDPEQILNTDKSPPLRRCVEHGAGQGTESLTVSSPRSQSWCIKDSSAAENPGVTAETLFSDSSIQRIIDRYTKELNLSLSTTGITTEDSGGSYVEDPGPSVSQRLLDSASERRGAAECSTVCQTLPSDTAGAQNCPLQWESTVNPVLQHFSGEDASQEHDSFRPLIGQLTDQSSCLAADRRDSTMEQLVGQPSAQSSVIGQLPGMLLSASLDRSGWDSTLNRMIGRLTHQSSSQWLSGGQDMCASQLMAQAPLEQSTSWLVEGLEESRMRPLVGELDESAGLHSGSSVERTHVDLGVSTGTNASSHPVLPPAASSHTASVLVVDLHPQDQTSPMGLGPDRTEASELFQPLLAEVTHNETADPSMTFHLPEHNVPDSPEELPDWDRALSEESPERLRTEEPISCVMASPASHGSFSQHHPCKSVLVLSPPTMMTDVELSALSLSKLTMCDQTPAVPQPEEAASEKGILEQSEITLVSLTDTTLQDQEESITEEGTWEGQKDQATEGTESVLQSESPEDKNEQLPVTLLQFDWGPSTGLKDVCQQRRRALLERSAHRVEKIKAKRTLGKTKPEAREQSGAKDRRPAVTCKATSEPRQKTNVEQHSGNSGLIQQSRVQLPAPVSDSRRERLDDMKICTPAQRKLDVSGMHQRTQRLYEQLEEVKHQKAIRRRQEASAKNRLKAKEFHKKTLQRLRAKQTQK